MPIMRSNRNNTTTEVVTQNTDQIIQNTTSIDDNSDLITANVDAIETINTQLTSLENSVEYSRYIVVPRTAYWKVADIQIDEYNIEIDSRPSTINPNGIRIVNNGNIQAYVTVAFDFGAPAAAVSPLSVRAQRINLESGANAVIMDNINLELNNLLVRSKIIVSSYGRSSEYENALIIELDITRFDSDENVWAIRAYTV